MRGGVIGRAGPRPPAVRIAVSGSAHRAGMTFTPRPDSLPARLDREWARLRRHPRSLRVVRSWAAAEPPGPVALALTGITDLGAMIERTRHGARADALLCRLIELAESEPLAGRIVIQRLLPGLIARSAPYRDYRTDLDPTEVVVAAAWIALRGYDVRRRPRHVAASLISDATFQAFRRPLRRKSATELATSPHELRTIEADPGPGCPTTHLVHVLREASAAGLPAGDVELIGRLVRAESPGCVAAHYGVTPRTIRNRRHAAIGRIRAALVA